MIRPRRPQLITRGSFGARRSAARFASAPRLRPAVRAEREALARHSAIMRPERPGKLHELCAPYGAFAGDGLKRSRRNQLRKGIDACHSKILEALLVSPAACFT